MVVPIREASRDILRHCARAQSIQGRIVYEGRMDDFRISGRHRQLLLLFWLLCAADDVARGMLRVQRLDDLRRAHPTHV